jgi:cytochrome c553
MHFIPRSQGGLGIKENLAAGCGLCHGQSHDGKNTIEIHGLIGKYLQRLYPNFTDEMRTYKKYKEE